MVIGIFGAYGAVAGFVFGFFYDKSRVLRLTNPRHNDEPMSEEETERVRQSFFSTTFSVMGHVAKADGQVQKSQIALAESIMEQMGLNAELRASAIELFSKASMRGSISICT